jgi:predicted transcriptional regulator
MMLRGVVEVQVLTLLALRTWTAPELAERLQQDPSVVQRALHRLRAAGEVRRRIGPRRGPQRPAVRWRLA